MPDRASIAKSRADFRSAEGVLLVLREPPAAPVPVKGQPALVAGNPDEGPEILLAVWDDGSVTGLNGHVDLGTGIRTSLAQIVAEELDVDFERVSMVLGNTAAAPNQGATIASTTIQTHAAPLRLAAAQCRHWMLSRVANLLGVATADLTVKSGVIALNDGSLREIHYGDLIKGSHIELMLAADTPTKSPIEYKIVGTDAPRVDIPAKVFGELTYVHDMRVPGMLHGRVVRPPYAGADHGDFIGKTLESVDESSVSHVAGVISVVVIGDFVGVVAATEDEAELAMRSLKVKWRAWPGIPDTENVENAIRANAATQRLLVDEGSVELALGAASQVMDRTYVWPYQLHASIGPSCAVAHWVEAEDGDATLTVWSGTQNPHVLRADLAILLGLPETSVDVVRMEAAGCYGRNCADDVTADAAILSQAVGLPVRVQLTREQEHAWEPKGAGQVMKVRGGLNADSSVAAYDFQTAYPSNGSPTLALLLTRTIEPTAQIYEMGDRTARPPYDFENVRVCVNDMPPILRASWLRGVSALPNTFAHESYIDELAAAAGIDPVEFRLTYLRDERGAELLRRTSGRAGWITHTAPKEKAHGQRGPEYLRGQGVAYARHVHSKWPGFGAAWSVWVADVEVNRTTGQVHVDRIVVGQDSGLLVNPAGARHQIEGNVIQTTSRALLEKVEVAPKTGAVTTQEWGSYPILRFQDLPTIDVVTIARPQDPPLGMGESSSIPGTAAIANAIFDATGVRFRQPPFTPEVVKEGLRKGSLLVEKPASGEIGPTTFPTIGGRAFSWASIATRAALFVAGLAGMAAAMTGWKSEIPLQAPIDPIYTADTLERGRLVAAAGNCLGCHTAPGGAPNAGGLAMETPFGTIYTTNLTPDPATGIGLWSYEAFRRAMREGISRDGRHLYPAFPYTSFAKIEDRDLQALYAYLMSQPAVESRPPQSKLAFPYSVRPMMAAWNGMFHHPVVFKAEPSQTPEWNRGAYLVNAAGHCTACHSPRNALGAEQAGSSFLAGAVIDGWEAPSLTNLSKAPVPWSKEALFQYLRNGYSARHGIAGGPMTSVVKELRHLPESDIRAMATYLASFRPSVDGEAEAEAAKRVVETATARSGQLLGRGQRLFLGACSSCHHDGDGPKLLGLNSPLALNTNLHSDRPDNLLRTVLEGVRDPVGHEIGYMPGFKDALTDDQIVELVGYMRARYAPDKRPWNGVAGTVARMRNGGD